MKPYQINAEMIGSDATHNDAVRVAEYLSQRGYNVEATTVSGILNENTDYIPDTVWMDAINSL